VHKESRGSDPCLKAKRAIALLFGPSARRVLRCPRTQGIDIYFESVGGKVFDAALPLLNTKVRVPVCGLISDYNSTQLPDGPDRLSLLMRAILVKRLTVQGFIIFDDYGHRYEEFSKDISVWLGAGPIKYREHLVDGLESAPKAFIGMLVGQNFGKLVVRVNDEH
jgi:NADPH-dependent curcumin reductase CurA